MKKITGNEDFRTPILLLLLLSMAFASEAREMVKNIESHGLINLSGPILFTGNTFETLARFCWFLIPATILLAAMKEKDLFLKLTYLLGAIPLFLTIPVISKLGFKSLYVIKVLIMFVAIMCLMKHLINTTDLYKKVLEEKTGNE